MATPLSKGQDMNSEPDRPGSSPTAGTSLIYSLKTSKLTCKMGITVVPPAIQA